MHERIRYERVTYSSWLSLGARPAHTRILAVLSSVRQEKEEWVD